MDDKELTKQERILAVTSPNLLRQFAVVEYRGDWKYHKECFGFSHYWKAARICHRCNAARLPGHGILYSQVGSPWVENTTMRAILDCMPASPNPLILVPGFHILCVKLAEINYILHDVSKSCVINFSGLNPASKARLFYAHIKSGDSPDASGRRAATPLREWRLWPADKAFGPATGACL